MQIVKQKKHIMDSNSKKDKTALKKKKPANAELNVNKRQMWIIKKFLQRKYF